MTFSGTAMMELGRKHPTNIHNSRSLIRSPKYPLETEEAFMVEEYTRAQPLFSRKLMRNN